MRAGDSLQRPVSTYLTPESEVLHFGFKVPDVRDLWPVLSVEIKNIDIYKCKNCAHFDSIHSNDARV